MLLDPNVGTRHLFNLLHYLFYCMGVVPPPQVFPEYCIFRLLCGDALPTRFQSMQIFKLSHH